MTHVADNRPRVPTCNSAPKLWSFLNTAVLVRAAAIAVGLGSALAILNQSDAVFGDTNVQILPIALVYATPLIVVTLSQMFGARQATIESRSHAYIVEPFAVTIRSHGIPLRAVTLGLAAGTTNTAIVFWKDWLTNEMMVEIPIGLIAQAFSLPILFGMASQAIAFRHAIARRPTQRRNATTVYCV